MTNTQTSVQRLPEFTVGNLYQENLETLRSYETRTKEYIIGTSNDISAAEIKWLNASLFGLNSDARILEIGSASGRDANYLKSLGYRVECSDAVPSFVKYLKEHGHDASLFNIVTDEIVRKYDLILANRVLLHFKRSEVAILLEKIINGLNDKGGFSFSLKSGKAEEWSTKKIGAPRYFCYWDKEEIQSVLIKAGFVRCYVEEDPRPHLGENWLLIVGIK